VLGVWLIAKKPESDQIDELAEDDVSVTQKIVTQYVYVMYCCLFSQDPLKEKETEMMMDYIERFNEVTN